MKLRRVLGSISNLSTERLSFSSSRRPSRHISTARSSSSQRNAVSKLSESLPGNHIKWTDLSVPARKTGEEMNFTYVECIAVPSAANSLCGYNKIATGQPSDRLGEYFSELNKDFTERLTTTKILTQGMSEHNKAMSAAKTDEVEGQAL